jgi:hypothetical protein
MMDVLRRLFEQVQGQAQRTSPTYAGKRADGLHRF